MTREPAHDEPTGPDVEPSTDDVERVAAALRAIRPANEPDWAALSAGIGAAIDDETRRSRRRRGWAVGGVVLAAAAVAALLVWPIARGKSAAPQARSAVDAAAVDGDDEIAAPRDDEPAADDGPDDVLDDDAIDDALAVPDDLGGITVDDELIDEAAAALDEDLGAEADDLDDRLLPDGAWIDELSDDELERAVQILDGEAG